MAKIGGFQFGIVDDATGAWTFMPLPPKTITVYRPSTGTDFTTIAYARNDGFVFDTPVALPVGEQLIVRTDIGSARVASGVTYVVEDDAAGPLAQLNVAATNKPSPDTVIVDTAAAELHWHYADEPAAAARYLGVFPVNQDVDVPLVADVDRAITIRAVAINNISPAKQAVVDAPFVTTGSNRTGPGTNPVMALVQQPNFRFMRFAIDNWNRYSRVREVHVHYAVGGLGDRRFIFDIDVPGQEFNELPDYFDIVRPSTDPVELGRNDYHIKVRHSADSTARAPGATYTEKVDGLAWGPWSEVLAASFGSGVHNPGSPIPDPPGQIGIANAAQLTGNIGLEAHADHMRAADLWNPGILVPFPVYQEIGGYKRWANQQVFGKHPSPPQPAGTVGQWGPSVCATSDGTDGFRYGAIGVYRKDDLPWETARFHFFRSRYQPDTPAVFKDDVLARIAVAAINENGTTDLQKAPKFTSRIDWYVDDVVTATHIPTAIEFAPGSSTANSAGDLVGVRSLLLDSKLNVVTGKDNLPVNAAAGFLWVPQFVGTPVATVPSPNYPGWKPLAFVGNDLYTHDGTRWKSLGGSGETGSWTWSSALSGDVATAVVAVNNDDPSLATELRISETDGAAVDFSGVFSGLIPGDGVYIQTSADGTKWVRYTIAGPGTDVGTYRTFPIEISDYGGVDLADAASTVVFSRGGGGGGGGGANPAGDATEIQYRFNATTFGAVTNSSVNGADVTLGGRFQVNQPAGTVATIIKVTDAAECGQLNFNRGRVGGVDLVGNDLTGRIVFYGRFAGGADKQFGYLQSQFSTAYGAPAGVITLGAGDFGNARVELLQTDLGTGGVTLWGNAATHYFQVQSGGFQFSHGTTGSIYYKTVTTPTVNGFFISLDIDQALDLGKVLTVTDTGGGVLLPRWVALASGGVRLDQVQNPNSPMAPPRVVTFEMADHQLVYHFAGAEAEECFVIETLGPGTGAAGGPAVLIRCSGTATQKSPLRIEGRGQFYFSVGVDGKVAIGAEAGLVHKLNVYHTNTGGTNVGVIHGSVSLGPGNTATTMTGSELRTTDAGNTAGLLSMTNLYLALDRDTAAVANAALVCNNVVGESNINATTGTVRGLVLGIQVHNAATVSNWEGLRIVAPGLFGGGVVTNRRAIITQSGAGFVGFGTLTPAVQLHVVGAVRADQTTDQAVAVYKTTDIITESPDLEFRRSRADGPYLTADNIAGRIRFSGWFSPAYKQLGYIQSTFNTTYGNAAILELGAGDVNNARVVVYQSDAGTGAVTLWADTAATYFQVQTAGFQFSHGTTGSIYYKDGPTPTGYFVSLDPVPADEGKALMQIKVPAGTGPLVPRWVALPAGTVTPPGGTNFQVQYNNNGSFGGVTNSANLSHVLKSAGTGAVPVFAALSAADILSGVLPLAFGGTGASLADPDADRILFWDDSGTTTAWLSTGTNLAIAGTVLSAIPTDPHFTLQFNNAGVFGSIANGPSGQVLRANGAGVVPSFGALSTGDLIGVLQLVQGGTGSSLLNPGFDRILFFDADGGAGGTGATTWLTVGANLSITGTTLNAAGAEGTTPTDPHYTLQFNNAGAFGAVTGSVVSGADVKLGGILTLSSAAALTHVIEKTAHVATETEVGTILFRGDRSGTPTNFGRIRAYWDDSYSQQSVIEIGTFDSATRLYISQVAATLVSGAHYFQALPGGLRISTGIDGGVFVQAGGNFVCTAAGTAAQYLKGGTTPTWGSLDAGHITAGIVPLARGGTGASLADPDVDKILFWDDSTGTTTWLAVGANLTIDGATNTLNAAAGATATTPADPANTLQYNNAGAFGAVTGSVVSGANLTLGGNLTFNRTDDATFITFNRLGAALVHGNVVGQLDFKDTAGVSTGIVRSYYDQFSGGNIVEIGQSDLARVSVATSHVTLLLGSHQVSIQSGGIQISTGLPGAIWYQGAAFMTALPIADTAGMFLKSNGSTPGWAGITATDWTGIVPITKGGTGYGTAPTLAGQILRAESATEYRPAALAAGTGISISNVSGTITITNDAPGSGATPPTDPHFTLQYNNAGVFGAVSGSVVSGADLALAGNLALAGTLNFPVAFITSSTHPTLGGVLRLAAKDGTKAWVDIQDNNPTTASASATLYAGGGVHFVQVQESGIRFSTGAAGSLWYQGVTYVTPISITGTAGMFLKSDGSVPGWAAISAADWTGIVPVTKGGTGWGTAPTIAGQILRAESGSEYRPATLAAGTGISISNASGTITITNDAPGSGATPPGGNPNELQFNEGGGFGGVDGSVVTGAHLELGGNLTFNRTSAGTVVTFNRLGAALVHGDEVARLDFKDSVGTVTGTVRSYYDQFSGGNQVEIGQTDLKRITIGPTHVTLLFSPHQISIQSGGIQISTGAPGSIWYQGTAFMTALPITGTGGMFLKSDGTVPGWSGIAVGDVVGILPIVKGGTGYGTAPTIAGQILRAESADEYRPATLAAGPGIAISNVSGTITITNNAPGSGATPPTDPYFTLQFNNSGAFGAMSGSVVTGADLALGGNLALAGTLNFPVGYVHSFTDGTLGGVLRLAAKDGVKARIDIQDNNPTTTANSVSLYAGGGAQFVQVQNGGITMSIGAAGSLLWQTGSSIQGISITDTGGMFLKSDGLAPFWSGIAVGDIAGILPITKGGTGWGTGPAVGQILRAATTTEYKPTTLEGAGTVTVSYDSLNNKIIISGTGGTGSPPGTGTTETPLQYRLNSTTFGGMSGSEVTGANLTLGGDLTFNRTNAGTVVIFNRLGTALAHGNEVGRLEFRNPAGASTGIVRSYYDQFSGGNQVEMGQSATARVTVSTTHVTLNFGAQEISLQSGGIQISTGLPGSIWYQGTSFMTAVPIHTDTSYVLRTDGLKPYWGPSPGGTGTATPGGSDLQLQWNEGGTFEGLASSRAGTAVNPGNPNPADVAFGGGVYLDNAGSDASQEFVISATAAGPTRMVLRSFKDNEIVGSYIQFERGRGTQSNWAALVSGDIIAEFRFVAQRGNYPTSTLQQLGTIQAYYSASLGGVMRMSARTASFVELTDNGAGTVNATLQAGTHYIQMQGTGIRLSVGDATTGGLLYQTGSQSVACEPLSADTTHVLRHNGTKPYWGVSPGGTGGTPPGGSSGTPLQYRFDATTFGAVATSGVTAAGWVGIGTTSPATRFNVVGDSQLQSAVGGFIFQVQSAGFYFSSGSTGSVYYKDSAGYFVPTTSGSSSQYLKGGIAPTWSSIDASHITTGALTLTQSVTSNSPTVTVDHTLGGSGTITNDYAQKIWFRHNHAGAISPGTGARVGLSLIWDHMNGGTGGIGTLGDSMLEMYAQNTGSISTAAYKLTAMTVVTYFPTVVGEFTALRINGVNATTRRAIVVESGGGDVVINRGDKLVQGATHGFLYIPCMTLPGGNVPPNGAISVPPGTAALVVGTDNHLWANLGLGWMRIAFS